MTGPDQTTPAAPARKPRHDAFDGKRKRAFLDALGKGGCVRDAARKAGVSHQTVYNHQRGDQAFARQCELALDMAGTDIELHAWERGVVGVEEPILYRGEIVGYRRKRSDAVLRLLLQATKPKKYGRLGFRRKPMSELKQWRAAKGLGRGHFPAAPAASQEEVDIELLKRLGQLGEAIRVKDKRRYEDDPAGADNGGKVADGPSRPGWAVLAQPDAKGEPRVRFV